MKLSMFKKNQKIFGPLNKNIGGMKSINSSRIAAAIFTCLLVSSESLAEPLSFSGGEHPAELKNIVRTDLRNVELALFGKADLLHQQNGDWIRNSIEFFPSVSVYSKPVAEPGTQAKSYNRPGETNQGRISIKQKNELIPDGAHSTRQLLLVLLTSALTVFPLGVYLSLRSACKRDYARGISSVKVPVLGLLSALIIPRKIKSRRWQIWEQRQWFRDMRLSHGIEVAYRDTWHWKKLVAGLWG
ncbi:hypothetical protein [Enterobacter hormaechei]|uniref:hypothetical protein n=1 Tax=Enterobacter hormaechei TaxID=158836 RepID=UPI003354F1E2